MGCDIRVVDAAIHLLLDFLEGSPPIRQLDKVIQFCGSGFKEGIVTWLRLGQPLIGRRRVLNDSVEMFSLF